MTDNDQGMYAFIRRLADGTVVTFDVQGEQILTGSPDDVRLLLSELQAHGLGDYEAYKLVKVA